MIQTPITERAEKIAQRVFSGKTDKTGFPCMRMRKAVADQMKDQYTAAIALLQGVYEYSEMNELMLFAEGAPQRVAYALSRLKQYENEKHEDYLRRLARDDLAYPVALATAEYLQELENYDTDLVVKVSECAYYSTKSRFLKWYRNGER